MAKVTGIGGVFFKVADPAATRAWYREHLGIEGDEHGVMFRWRSPDSPDDESGMTIWSPFAANTKYFAPSAASFMINYRVDDMDGLLAHLREKGIEIVGTQDEDYGRFAWIMDPDGNKLELWQPTAGG